MNFRPKQALLSIIIVLILLTACQASPLPTSVAITATPSGGDPLPEPEGKQPTEAIDTPAVPSPTPEDKFALELSELPGKEIEFWHPWTGILAAQVQKSAEQFNRTNEWGVKVRVTAFYNSSALFEAVNKIHQGNGGPGTPAPAGQMPDMIAASTDQLATWAEAKPSIMVDLDPYIASAHLGLDQAEVDAYIPLYWNQDVREEIRYGIPALRNARIIVYNQTWAEKLGFDRPPSTPDEFKEQACAAAVANNTAKVLDLYGTGGWLVDTDPLTTLSWMSAFGSDPLPGSEGQPYKFESKESQEALSFLRGMVDEGCAWNSNGPGPYDAFTNRKALFYTGSLPDLLTQTSWQEQFKSQDEWTALPFPGKDGKPVLFSSGFSYSIFQSTPVKQLGAWLFIRWMSQPAEGAKLAELMPSLPVSSSFAEKISDSQMPVTWKPVILLSDGLHTTPSFSSWRQARRPLEDTAWQVYHLPADELPQILQQLDAAIIDLLTK